MKVLFLNTYDQGGGAAKMAISLYNSLNGKHLFNDFLVYRKSTDLSVIGFSDYFHPLFISFFSVIDNFHELFLKNLKTKFSLSFFSSSTFLKIVEDIKPDLIHLHWINNGFVSIEKLKKIKVPIVWTIHDSFPFTGGCHVIYDCERYKTGCGRCPLLKSNRNYDLSKWVYNRKLKIYPQINNINFVGVSKWITEIASSSLVMKNMPIHYIPNMINTTVFRPIEKIKSRNELNLPLNLKLILFGANSVKSDYNKGFHLLLQALNLIIDFNFALVIVGNESNELEIPINNEKYRFSHINDSNQMAKLFSACDLFVSPSYQESFGLMIAESMSCGTPSVAFNSSGQKDIIDHRKNGYLAEPYLAEDLAEGIKWVLNHPNYDEISSAARGKIVKEFDSRIVAQKYIELYQSILNK